MKSSKQAIIKFIFYVVVAATSTVLHAESPVIKLNKSIVIQGEKITVTYLSPVKLPKGAWIGLFPSTVAKKSTSNYVSFQYLTQDKKNSLVFTAPGKPGKYDFRLHKKEYDGIVLTTASFVVKNLDSNKITMTLDKSSYATGTKIALTYKSDIKLNKMSWIGLVPSNTPHGSGKVIDKHDLQFDYIYNSKKFNFRAPEIPGKYDLRLVSVGNNSSELKSVSFEVTIADSKNVKLTLVKTKWGPGEKIKLNFVSNEQYSNQAWIGLIPGNVKHGKANENDKYDIDYRYLNKKNKGHFLFTTPDTKGQYSFRLFNSNAGIEVTHVNFSVTHSVNAEFLKKELNDKGKVVLNGIYFDTGKDTIKPESKPLLKEVATLLKNNATLSLRIEGHTDNKGSNDSNMQLSKKRSSAIKIYLLTNFKIQSSRLSAKGLGESKPVADNSTAFGRSQNRRVELIKN